MKCGHVLLLTEFQNQGFKSNLNDENSPMLIKISCKVHIYSNNPRISFTGWAFRPLPCIPCRVLVRGLPVLLSPHSWCVSFYDILAIVKQSNSAS